MKIVEEGEFGSWDVQLLVWGAYWWGDAAEQDAMLCEAMNGHEPDIGWDRTRSSLDTCERFHGNLRLPTPDWWAFAHLPESWIEQAFDEEDRLLGRMV